MVLDDVLSLQATRAPTPRAVTRARTCRVFIAVQPVIWLAFRAVSVLIVIARVVVATVFGLAALAKVVTPVATRAAITDFGIRERFSVAGALLLPLAELGAAVMIAIPATSWWGALPALVLIAVFSVGIIVNLGRGRRPECRCFGEFLSSKVGPGLLMRNAAFVVPIVIVLVGV